MGRWKRFRLRVLKHMHNKLSPWLKRKSKCCPKGCLENIHLKHYLIHTIFFFMCGMFLAIRSGSERCNLRLSPPQISVLETSKDPYIAYKEDISKNRQGSLKYQNFSIKQRTLFKFRESIKMLCMTLQTVHH